MESSIHLVVENFHILEVVYIEVVVLGSNCVGIGVILGMVHMVVGMMDMG